MPGSELRAVAGSLGALKVVRPVGRVEAVQGGTVQVTGLSGQVAVGDVLRIERRGRGWLEGEILNVSATGLVALTDGAPEGVTRGDRVTARGAARVAPSRSWIGRIVDPMGLPLDGRPLLPGEHHRPLGSEPPPAAERRGFGVRLETGINLFDTMLPIVRGQRIGLFAGSGVGKSRLLANLARRCEADVVVLGLVGERGRELGDFVRNVLGPDGMARSVVVAATSDRSALQRRRCAQTAMTVAEHFRDQGAQVLVLIDSVTRYAEAHREVAVAAGELPAMRGFPASVAHNIMSLCERAGPGTAESGDITAVFSVLVAGSDMEEPIADILRGVLDGHVVLDRKIAERGRFPAVDVSRSVSRSLPEAADDKENALIAETRQLLAGYARTETMIQAGLYREGADAVVDQAVRAREPLEAFFAETNGRGSDEAFLQLSLILRRAASTGSGAQRR